MADFASALKEARLARGWTQVIVARKLGTNQFTVARWESGRVRPREYHRAKLCVLFGMSAEALGLLPVISPIRSVKVQDGHLPSLWSVPYPRNPFFTGRETLLSHVQELLTQEHRMALTQSLALSGLGGIGKTQIALEYAYHYRHHYRFVFWMNAATQDGLLADMVRIARLLELPLSNDPDQHRVQGAVKEWLASHPDWLLILDNADDMAMIHDCIPIELPGHLLLTSRAQALGSLALRIDVEDMSMVESILLLLRRAKLLAAHAPLDQVSPAHLGDAESIVIDLAFLPLAIDQAGAYIDEVGCSLATYRHLFVTRRKELLQRRGNVPTDYPDSVATTWSLSFQHIAQICPPATDLLRLSAFLDPDTISEDLLIAGSSSLGVLSTDPLQLHEALEALRKFSFLVTNPVTRTFRIHRMVQAVLKDTMAFDQQRHWARCAVQATHAIFPDHVELETWPDCLRLLGQAQSCAHLIQEIWDLRWRGGNAPDTRRLLFGIASAVSASGTVI